MNPESMHFGGSNFDDFVKHEIHSPGMGGLHFPTSREMFSEGSNERHEQGNFFLHFISNNFVENLNLNY